MFVQKSGKECVCVAIKLFIETILVHEQWFKHKNSEYNVMCCHVWQFMQIDQHQNTQAFNDFSTR